MTAILDKASDEQLGYVIREAMTSSSTGVARRGIFDWMDKVKAWFKSIGVKIKSKFSDFAAWAAEHWTKALDKIREKMSTVAALAKEVSLIICGLLAAVPGVPRG